MTEVTPQVRLYTIQEAARLLGINPHTLRRWEWKGKVSFRRNGMNNHRVFTATDIEALKKMMRGE